VVTDGESGLIKALNMLWPKVKIQRCLVHIQRSVRGYLTKNPRTDPGKSLRYLSLKLTKIRTQEIAAEWIAAFASWHATHQFLIDEETYAKDWSGPLPSGIKPTRKWWYTHERLRSAYKSMANPLKQGHLFTYLDDDLTGLGASATTNMIEGAINSGIREMIRFHRGMPIEHRRRACEWSYWSHADEHDRTKLALLIKESEQLLREQEAKKVPAEEVISPEFFGTASIAEEGLYARAGWGWE